MRTPLLFLLLLGSILLASPLWAGGEAPRLAVKVYGAVEHPGDFRVEPADATLALMLERAGWICDCGSDTIRVAYRKGDKVRVFQTQGRDFYAHDTDYMLPDESTVFVVEYVLGNLSSEGYVRLQKLREDYLRRRREGKIKIVPLLEPR